MQGQLVSHQGGTYILQPGTDVMESDGMPVHHMTRASPATVEWLLEHFEPYEGVSLARYRFYSHYLRHCMENNLDAMNAASFGKLIRSVFLGLKTRRLGARGNSKYHYYGIRVKPSSPLNQFSDNVINMSRSSIRTMTGEPKKNPKIEPEYEVEKSKKADVTGSTISYQQLDPTEQAQIQEHLQVDSRIKRMFPNP
jgi:hypothetical protein